MHDDPVLTAFLQGAAADADACRAASDILDLVPHESPGGPPRVYEGRFVDVEHLVPMPDGTIRPSSDPIPFTVTFPSDYCRSTDSGLQFRVAAVQAPLYHPNVRGGIVCLGPHFRPSTRLRPIIEQLYRIAAAVTFATNHAFDADACRYYLDHLEQVQALRARPLWRRALTCRSVPPARSALSGTAGRDRESSS